MPSIVCSPVKERLAVERFTTGSFQKIPAAAALAVAALDEAADADPDAAVAKLAALAD